MTEQQQPQEQPQWSPPPQQQPGWGGGGAAPVERPMGVTLAAIYLIVMGVLVGLLGACVGVIGGALGGVSGVDDPTGMFAAFAGMALIGGLIIVAIGVIQIVAGAGILSGKSWARWTGIIISVIVVILMVLGVVTALGAGANISDSIVSMVIGVLYALTAWALFQANAFFAARR